MGFTPRKVRIYRKTLNTDDFASLGASEKLEFNANATNTDVANGFTTNIHKGIPRSIATHSNPNENLGEQQDTGLDEDVYTIHATISRPDLTANIFMNNLVEWQETGEQESAVEQPFGRFSIEIDRAPALNKTSSKADGLEIRSIDFDLPGETPNECDVIIVLSRGKEVS